MNKILVLTAGSAGLILAAGSAVAAAPGGGGFGQFTATTGTITATSMVGTSTPTTLISGLGFLQQKVDVTAGPGSGQSFYRTIILDSSADTTGTLGFKNETFVGASTNSGNLASEGFVALSAPTGVANAGSGSTSTTTMSGVTIPTNSTEALLARGSLALTGSITDIKNGTADPTGIKILQNNNFDVDTTAAGSTIADGASLGRSLNFAYLSNSATTGPGTNASFYMRMDEFENNDGLTGPVTARRSSGDFTAAGTGALVTPVGVDPASTVTYSAGDDIAVTFISTDALGGGTFGFPTTGTAVGGHGGANGITEALTFRNYTTTSVASFVNDNYRQVATNAAVISNGTDPGDDLTSMTGMMQAYFTPQNTTSVVAQWNAANWDANFGGAPAGQYRNAAGTGSVDPTPQATAFPLPF